MKGIVFGGTSLSIVPQMQTKFVVAWRVKRCEIETTIVVDVEVTLMVDNTYKEALPSPPKSTPTHLLSVYGGKGKRDGGRETAMPRGEVDLSIKTVPCNTVSRILEEDLRAHHGVIVFGGKGVVEKNITRGEECLGKTDIAHVNS